VEWCINGLETIIAVSDSEGSLTLIQLENGNAQTLSRFALHQFQCWTLACDKNDPNIFYTGGDDAVLKITDKRSALSKQCKAHGSGVTALVTSRKHENILLSGRYIDQVLTTSIVYIVLD